MSKHSSSKSFIVKVKNQHGENQLAKLINSSEDVKLITLADGKKKPVMRGKQVMVGRKDTTVKQEPTCVSRSISVDGPMSVYGKMYNQEEKDVDRAVKSLTKYIRK